MYSAHPLSQRRSQQDIEWHVPSQSARHAPCGPKNCIYQPHAMLAQRVVWSHAWSNQAPFIYITGNATGNLQEHCLETFGTLFEHRDVRTEAKETQGRSLTRTRREPFRNHMRTAMCPHRPLAPGTASPGHPKPYKTNCFDVFPPLSAPWGCQPWTPKAL